MGGRVIQIKVLNVSLDNGNKNCKIEKENAGVAAATASISDEDIAVFIHFMWDNLEP